MFLFVLKLIVRKIDKCYSKMYKYHPMFYMRRLILNSLYLT